MDLLKKRGCRPLLVVVLQEARNLVLVIQSRPEVLPHRPGVPVAEAVLQPIVVVAIEPLLLERPLEVPATSVATQKKGCFDNTHVLIPYATQTRRKEITPRRGAAPGLA
jgi:hypothetical protein